MFGCNLFYLYIFKDFYNLYVLSLNKRHEKYLLHLVHIYFLVLFISL